VGTKLNNPPIYDEVVNNKKEFTGEALVGGIPMKVFYGPFFNEGDKPEDKAMGMFFAGIPVERGTTVIRHNLRSNLSITAFGLLIFLLMLIGIVRAIVGPIRIITKAAEDLADGKLDIDVNIRTKDETASLATAFQHLTSSLKAKTDVALAIATGDLRVWVPLRSNHDELGLSLIRMRYSLYDSIKGLKGLAESVHAEAISLTNVNQSLVDNATHSADQCKEIAESTRALHEKTVQNAEESRNAENLTKSAQAGSNDGKEKMGRMVQAMDSITKSSDEIKKIIRVIDDIAFQTNLLALNAAVEAARAGQHGKGFAVVAEEVRNLASRSAKAASETAGLIEESIQHVGLGSSVAHETAESLNVITEQVEKINKIVSTISGESDAQAKHLGEMTDTVTQVSATADANMQSVHEVTTVIDSISKTAQGLHVIIEHFKANEEGKVMVEGQKYPGFVPPHGTFTHTKYNVC
jgi:methyl-accepting chemotaxis protein